VGIRRLLCRHRGCELEIPLYDTHRFLNLDYLMFDCGGMAFKEPGFDPSLTIARSEVQTALLRVPGTHQESWSNRVY